MIVNENKQYLKNVEDFVNKNPDTVRSLFVDRIIGFGDILDLYNNYSDMKFGSITQVICFLQYLHEPQHRWSDTVSFNATYDEIKQFCLNTIEKRAQRRKDEID